MSKPNIDFKIISNTDEEIEFEITQPNDYAPEESRVWWSPEDFEKWDEKMARLEVEGIRGQLETIRTKLKKNPFIDGSQYIAGANNTEQNNNTGEVTHSEKI